MLKIVGPKNSGWGIQSCRKVWGLHKIFNQVRIRLMSLRLMIIESRKNQDFILEKIKDRSLSIIQMKHFIETMMSKLEIKLENLVNSMRTISSNTKCSERIGC